MEMCVSSLCITMGVGLDMYVNISLNLPYFTEKGNMLYYISFP